MCKKYKSAARLRYVIHNSRQDWQKNSAPARTHRSQARQGSEAQANSWGASTEPRCRWAALQVGSRARRGAPEKPLPPATAEPRPLSGPAPSRARHRRGAPCNQSGGADGSSRTRPTPAPVGWAGLQRRRWGGERLLCGRRAGPRGGRARCRWCALPAGAAPPPSSPPALPGRRGAGRRRSGGISSSEHVVEQGQESEDGHQVVPGVWPAGEAGRGVARCGSCPVLSCQPSRAWLPGPLCPQCRPAQQPYRWGSVSERGEPRAGRGCAGPQYRFGAPGPAPQGPARPAPVRGLPAEPRRSSCFLSAPLACGCLSMYVLYNMRLQR